ncbi:LuxR C-terminal-related transcriptional regulator [Nocardia sp. NPDC004415]
MRPIALDCLPNAREILRSIEAAPQKPVVLLLSGRSGTGKSVLLDAARQRLRGRGLAVIASVPVAPDSGAVVVLDDLHTLTAAQLDALSAEITSGTRSFLCATQPRPQHPELRALCETVARHGRTVELRALGSGDIGSLARELGVTVPRPIIDYIHTRTGGVHAGVVAALLAAGAARLDQGMAAVDDALAAWTRSQLAGADPALLDTLVVAATGTGLDAGELAEVLDLEPAVARDLLVRARTSALVTDADLLLAAAVPQLRVLIGDRRYVAVQRRLLDTRLAAGLLRDHTGLLLAESGVRDERLAEFLCRAAEHNRIDAARYYAAASAAGADPRRIALPWAEAAAATGDNDTALRLAEPLLDRVDAPAAELAAAVRICATVLTRRGLVQRAAALYRWLGAHRVGADWAVATTVLALAGDSAAADMSADADRWPPTEATAGPRLIARALLASLDSATPTPPGSEDTDHPRSRPATAITDLTQALRTDHRTGPCGAIAVATLLNLSAGDPARAAAALWAVTESRGPADGSPDSHAQQQQHSATDHPSRRFTEAGRIPVPEAPADPQRTILAAWVALATGDEQRAAEMLGALGHAPLFARDRLLAHGLSVGLARRGGDLSALRRAWTVALPAFEKVDIDLLGLLAVGEMWMAGIALREERRVQNAVDAATALVRGLAHASAWTAVFHWYGVQAALGQNEPQQLLPHAHALKQAAAEGDAHAAVLADAGRTWLLVRRGEADITSVRTAVLALADRGHAYDAARLAEDAARGVDDPAELLELAGSVRLPARPDQAVTSADDPHSARRPLIEPQALSDREREVAELVLLGLTYREIGARLYISAKTVEHHVARIRRRIGARSRSELLSMLRAMGHGSLLV